MNYFENKLIRAMNNIPGFIKAFGEMQELFFKYERTKACFGFKEDEAFQAWFEKEKEANPKADTCKLYADCLDLLERDLMVGGDLPWREEK